MKQIPLTQGKTLLVDDPADPSLPPAFASRLREALKYRWHPTSADGELWYAYRLIVRRDANGQPMRKKPKRGKRGALMYTTERLHRYLLQDELRPELEVDHRNHNGLDCRYSNLRVCTRTENTRNRRRNRNHCSSRFKGVSRTAAGTYQAAIRGDGRMKYLGTYAEEVSAAIAYNNAARQQWGEFAYLNPVESGSRPLLQ